MSNDFIKIINDIYNKINLPIDIIYKLAAINDCKVQLNIGRIESFGEYYFKIQKDRKEKGLIYTPKNIAKFIIENTIKSENIINDPFLKILDPACGCGNLIIPCFKHLKEIYLKNLSEINTKNGLSLSEENINLHIINNNLFGYDIDGFAMKILILDLFTVSESVNCHNFNEKDFLIDEINESYDIIIGNPPYIGQKSIDKDYSNKLKNRFKQLYKDKGDISYCFFGAALNNLKEHGKLTFITSRYFIESPSGESLRKTLKELCSIEKIVDFYGVRPFKNAGIDPVIIFTTIGGTSCEVEVIKPLVKKQDIFCSGLFENKVDSILDFFINKNDLKDSGWVLRDEVEKNITKKIEKKCVTTLENICNSFQGIITGCDKAFIVGEQNIIEEDIELDIIKPWIKSSCIAKNKVSKIGKFIIYSDTIQDESKYKNSINHIKPYKEKLEERRECKKGFRRWYQLQWGRAQNIFEGEKIVFPFKANKNRFAYDTGSYFSADVYCLTLKKESNYNYEFILQLLNSKLYEYYFKTFAKKLGEDLYDYYPNNLMKLCIPDIIKINDDVDKYLYSYFNITDEEINIIKEYAMD
jgi:adenine-specific DNA-methyltransferase